MQYDRSPHTSPPLSYCIDLPMKMERIEGSETSAISTQTPGKHPKENIVSIYLGDKAKWCNKHGTTM
jgi:hypothetical protein